MKDFLSSPLWQGVQGIGTVISLAITVYQLMAHRASIPRPRRSIPAVLSSRLLWIGVSSFIIIVTMESRPSFQPVAVHSPWNNSAIARGGTTITPMTSLTTSPIITIENKLVLPAIVTVGHSSPRTVDADSKATFLIDPGDQIENTIVSNTNQVGNSVGDIMKSLFKDVQPGDTLVINNVIGTQHYFYLILNNKYNQDCNVVVNEGRSYENKPEGFIPRNSDNYGFGYYILNNDSNVVAYCGDYVQWFGIRDGDPNSQSFATEVAHDSGVIEFTIRK